MDEIEHELLEIARAVERLAQQSSSVREMVGAADAQLGEELRSAADGLRADAAEITDVASRWHNVDR